MELIIVSAGLVGLLVGWQAAPQIVNGDLENLSRHPTGESPEVANKLLP